MVLKNPTFVNPNLKGLFVWESSWEGKPDPQDEKIKLGVQITPIQEILDDYKTDGKVLLRRLENVKEDTFSDKNNVGIWHKRNNITNKVAAIGVRVKKWIAYHGFSININNNLDQYKKIIPCGIRDKGVTNLINIANNDYSNLDDLLIEKFISNLKI